MSSPQELFLKARRAMEFQNCDSTLYWMHQLLGQEPHSLEARLLARQAALERWRKSPILFFRWIWNVFGIFCLFFEVIKIRFFYKKSDLLKALLHAEQLLGKFPMQMKIHYWIAHLAIDLGASFYSIALLSLEVLCDIHPKKNKLLQKMATACLLPNQQGRAWNAMRAKELYEVILLQDPNCLIAKKGIKRAAAALSLQVSVQHSESQTEFI